MLESMRGEVREIKMVRGTVLKGDGIDFIQWIVRIPGKKTGSPFALSSLWNKTGKDSEKLYVLVKPQVEQDAKYNLALIY